MADEQTKPVPTLAQVQKERKDNIIASRWGTLLFMISSIILAVAGNLLCVPAGVVAVMLYVKGKTEVIQ